MKNKKQLLWLIFPAVCLVVSMALIFSGVFKRSSVEPYIPASLIENKNVTVSAADTGASTAAVSDKGGALYLKPGARHTMKNGTISTKVATYGGAVYVSENATFTLEGGTITQCWAQYGGAIYVANGGTCIIKGGKIISNMAEDAPAIYVEEGGTLTVENDGVIQENEQREFKVKVRAETLGWITPVFAYDFNTPCTQLIDDIETYFKGKMEYYYNIGWFIDEELTKSAEKYSTTTELIKSYGIEHGGILLHTRGFDIVEDSEIIEYTMSNLEFSQSDSSTDEVYISDFRDETYAGEVFIPARLDGKKVVNLGGAAFANTKISKIYLPSTLRVVCDQCFMDTPNLTSITFSDAITEIGYMCFSNSGLVTANIPGSVEYAVGAFRDTKHLNTVKMEDGCDFIFPEMFIESSIKSIVIPKSVRWIYDAFCGCTSLTDVTVLGELEHIETNAFNSCTNLNNITLQKVGDICPSAFESCTSLESIDLSNGVNQIAPAAFRYSGLKSITIPQSTTYVGEVAFGGCSSLTKVVFENQLEKIEDCMFMECINLSEVTFPSNVKEVGLNAFNSCIGLVNLSLPSTLYSIGQTAFANCQGLTTVVLPENLRNIGLAAFADCVNLALCDLPENLSLLGDGAFSNTAVSSVRIPAKTVLEGCVYDSCKNLTSIVVDPANPYYTSRNKAGEEINAIIGISEKTLIQGLDQNSLPNDGSVTTIGRNAFAGRDNLTEIHILDMITKIDNNAFARCTNLEWVTMENSVTELGMNVFRNCSALKFVRLSENITRLEKFVFGKCTSLEYIVVPHSVEYINSNAFAECSDIKALYVPASVNEFSLNYYIEPWVAIYCEVNNEISNSLGELFNDPDIPYKPEISTGKTLDEFYSLLDSLNIEYRV